MTPYEVNEFIVKKFNLEIQEGKFIYVFEDGMDRSKMAELFCELGYTKGAEIGVEWGINSEVLLANNPNLTLMCIDRWSTRRRLERHAIHKLAKFGSRAVIIKATSMEQACKVPDFSLDFAYIDADHGYNNVMRDVICWAEKVRPGGILSGHDYFLGKRRVKVIEAVTDYIRENPIVTRLYVSNCVHPSWMWVRV